MEQQSVPGRTEWQVSQLIEDDEIGMDEPVCDLSRLALGFFLLQCIDEFNGGEVADTLAVMFDGLDSEGCCKMVFFGSGWKGLTMSIISKKIREDCSLRVSSAAWRGEMCGRSAALLRRGGYAGRQPDGSLVLVPIWMTEEPAAAMALVEAPHLSFFSLFEHMDAIMLKERLCDDCVSHLCNIFSKYNHSKI